MYILGINQDLYDCGVTVADGRKIIFSANEERYNRRKNQGGFPLMAIRGLLEYTRIRPEDIHGICVAGIITPPLLLRMMPRIHNLVIREKRKRKKTAVSIAADFIAFNTPISHMNADSKLREMTLRFLPTVYRRLLSRQLEYDFSGIPIHIIEHHTAHVYAAWQLSGFNETLCITADGMGDGLSMTVSRCHKERVERLWSARSYDSFGLFFETVTEALGFTPCRDEGKIAGLAAAGNPEKITIIPPFKYSDQQLKYCAHLGARGVKWIKDTLVNRFSREDISAWAQNLLEFYVLKIATTWLRKTGQRKLVLAGGVFSNVRLNQCLHELEEVEKLFVCPNMGDGGLSLGAVAAVGGVEQAPIQNVFWGEKYSEQVITRILKKNNLSFKRCPKIAGKIAQLVAEGKIVARFTGRMEWGPRALGNRSILANALSPEITDRLNQLLIRSDFMPFAPVLLDDDADHYVVGVEKARHAAEFMTVCFKCRPRMKAESPAAVHVDGTARAQIVRKDTNPAFYEVLKAYKSKTGSSVMLNTSFNLHEEPIVRTPQEAVNVFLKAKLDYMAINDFLVENHHMHSI